ncbi:hypothetical protein P9112_010547 [Eukaryota sp. TZLM1-RC]
MMYEEANSNNGRLKHYHPNLYWPNVEVFQTSNKGRGLRASQDIPRYSVVLFEQAFCFDKPPKSISTEDSACHQLVFDKLSLYSGKETQNVKSFSTSLGQMGRKSTARRYKIESEVI